MKIINMEGSAKYKDPNYRLTMKENIRQGNLSELKETGKVTAEKERNAAMVEVSERARHMYECSLENEYMDEFSEAANGFKKSISYTYGDYKNHDFSERELDFEAIDRMEDAYQKKKESILSYYSGKAQTYQMERLDSAYKKAMEKEILNPLKGAFEHKQLMFDCSDELVGEISASKDTVKDVLARRIASFEMNAKRFEKLTNGTKDFFELLENTESWHNTNYMKTVISKSVKQYAAVTEWNINSGEYCSVKSDADKTAKKVMDRYGQGIMNAGKYKLGRISELKAILDK